MLGSRKQRNIWTGRRLAIIPVMPALFFLCVLAVLLQIIQPSHGIAGRVADFFTGQKSIAGIKAKFHLAPNDASAIDWSPDSKFLAVSGILNPYVKVFDVQNKTLVMTLRKLAGGSHGLAYSPDGRFLAAGNSFTQMIKGVSVHIWDAKTGVMLKNIIGPFPTDKPANSVTYLAFSPDGRYLAVGYRGNFPHAGVNIYIYETTSWTPIRSFGDAKEVIHGGLLFSPDGRHIAHGTLEGAIWFWDVASGQLRRAIRAHSDYVESLAYSPDGKWIVSGTATGSIRGHLNKATGKFVKVKNEEQVKVWQADDGDKPMATLNGFTATVRTLSISPDGQFLVTGSDDEAVKIWDTRRWKIVGRLATTTAPLMAVFSPDSKYLAVGAGGAATVWELRRQ